MIGKYRWRMLLVLPVERIVCDKYMISLRKVEDGGEIETEYYSVLLRKWMSCFLRNIKAVLLVFYYRSVVADLKVEEIRKRFVVDNEV